MFDARTLKPEIAVTETHTECPVIGCSEKVMRQRRVFRRDRQFQCPNHRIFISPGTFEYSNESDNLLWKDIGDITLLQNIKTVKRESRIARDNSEDALTWNVFRYLDKTCRLSEVLSHITGKPLANSELIYWSYLPRSENTWTELASARQEFGEELQRSSEPDLIAVNDESVIFIEAKFTATNNTQPSDPHNPKKYTTGGNRWYNEVFKSDYATVANTAKKYELLRFWLLGSWIASETNREFYLINLVRAEYEKDIISRFIPYIRENDTRHFIRVAWENIYSHILNNISPDKDRDMLLNYLRYKTVGYNQSGKLQRAFSIKQDG